MSMNVKKRISPHKHLSSDIIPSVNFTVPNIIGSGGEIDLSNLPYINVQGSAYFHQMLEVKGESLHLYYSDIINITTGLLFDDKYNTPADDSAHIRFTNTNDPIHSASLYQIVLMEPHISPAIVCSHQMILRKDLFMRGMVNTLEGAIVLHGGSQYRGWGRPNSNPGIFLSEENHYTLEIVKMISPTYPFADLQCANITANHINPEVDNTYGLGGAGNAWAGICTHTLYADALKKLNGTDWVLSWDGGTVHSDITIQKASPMLHLMANTPTDAALVYSDASVVKMALAYSSDSDHLYVYDYTAQPSRKILTLNHNGQLSLPLQNSSSGGFLAGGDCNLYRDAANRWGTDDDLVIQKASPMLHLRATTASDSALVYSDASVVKMALAYSSDNDHLYLWDYNGARSVFRLSHNGDLWVNASLAVGADCSLYRDAANRWGTDDDLVIQKANPMLHLRATNASDAALVYSDASVIKMALAYRSSTDLLYVIDYTGGGRDLLRLNHNGDLWLLGGIGIDGNDIIQWNTYGSADWTNLGSLRFHNTYNNLAFEIKGIAHNFGTGILYPIVQMMFWDGGNPTVIFEFRMNGDFRYLGSLIHMDSMDDLAVLRQVKPMTVDGKDMYDPDTLGFLREDGMYSLNRCIGWELSMQRRFLEKHDEQEALISALYDGAETHDAEILRLKEEIAELKSQVDLLKSEKGGVS